MSVQVLAVAPSPAWGSRFVYIHVVDEHGAVSEHEILPTAGPNALCALKILIETSAADDWITDEGFRELLSAIEHDYIEEDD